MSSSFQSDQEIREATRLLLQSSTPDQQKADIMDAIHALGQSAVPHLRVLLEGARSRPVEMQRDAVIFVERFSKAQINLTILVKPLAGYLNTIDATMREVITEIISKMGEKAKPAEDFALGCLRNSNRDIVICGLRILDAIGRQCSTSITGRLQAAEKSFADDPDIMPLLKSIRGAMSGQRTSQRRKAIPAVTGSLPELPTNCLKGFRCLVVEDVTPVRQLLASVLCRFGMNVVGAADGETAMTILRDRVGGDEMPDIVLLDMRLPGANGIQVLQCMREELELSIPVIALTGIMNRDIVLLAQQLGIKHYLIKPVSIERAIKCILNALDVSIEANSVAT